jgi:hypothetical protein
LAATPELLELIEKSAFEHFDKTLTTQSTEKSAIKAALQVLVSQSFTNFTNILQACFTNYMHQPESRVVASLTALLQRINSTGG